MSEFTSEIMNITPDADYIKDLELRIAYKSGHREARHAAAVIALKADAEIERLQREVNIFKFWTEGSFNGKAAEDFIKNASTFKLVDL